MPWEIISSVGVSLHYWCGWQRFGILLRNLPQNICGAPKQELRSRYEEIPQSDFEKLCVLSDERNWLRKALQCQKEDVSSLKSSAICQNEVLSLKNSATCQKEDSFVVAGRD